MRKIVCAVGSLAVSILVIGCAATSEKADAFYAEGQYREAVTSYAEYLEDKPKDARAHFALGDSLYLKYTDDYQKGRADTNDLSRALAHFTTAAQLEPGYAPTYSQRGVVSLTLGNKEAAKQDYDKAISLDPNFDRSYFNRGYWYEQAGNFAAALADYRRYEGMTTNLKWKEDATRRIETLELRMKVGSSRKN